MEEYFANLWERWRRGEAQRMRYEHWPTAQRSRCHENVDAYVRERPGCKAIRGAWVQPIGDADGCMFHAHSLVELPDGEWMDITPLADESQRASLVFLKHRGTEEQFQFFRTRFPQVIWPPMDIPAQTEGDFASGEGLM